MTIDEGAVARHYGKAGLLARIDAGLNAMGVDLDHLTIDDLAPVDEFHVGGRKATDHALDALAPRTGQRILDVGCGIGGTARYMAVESGCRVAGIDLTPEFIAVARTLSARLGLSEMLAFEIASALAMPFEDAAFDAATSFHVAMNIAERDRLYGEIARVMRPGATLCIYDVMKTGPGEILYLVPWAETAATSHVTSPEEMQALLGEAGFEIGEIENQRDFALQFFRRRLGAVGDAPPPLGLHLVMGDNWKHKFKNTLGNIEAGRIAPVLMIAHKRK